MHIYRSCVYVKAGHVTTARDKREPQANITYTYTLQHGRENISVLEMGIRLSLYTRPFLQFRNIITCAQSNYNAARLRDVKASPSFKYILPTSAIPLYLFPSRDIIVLYIAAIQCGNRDKLHGCTRRYFPVLI